MRRVFMPALLAGAAMWLCGETFAAAAVFGSFQSRGNAERFCTELVRHPELGVRVVAVETERGRLYRVISAPGDERQTRALMAQAQALGIAPAWYWADAPDTEPATAVAEQAPPAEPPLPAASEDVPPTRTAPEPAPVVAAAKPEEDGSPPPAGRDLTLQADGEAIVVPRIDGAAITIDGHLDEAIWNDIPGYDNMMVVEPDTLTPARFRTVARYFYTDRGLYVGVWNEQPPDTLIARLSSRDEFINRDSWGLTLDTSGEGLYGYWFSVNLGGSVMDGKVAPERNYSREWDGPWDSATVALDDGWSVELFLPWSMMSMPRAAGDRVMGLYATRKVAYLDERWGWPALPRTVARFMSALQPMSVPGVVPKEQLEAYPYLSGSVEAADGSEKFNAGVDVFWRPSSNFQVTAAVLPDFGAVETDDVVINLTARETYFPEKRLFFLEGSEIFATSGRSATPRPGGDSNSGMTAESGGSRRTMSSFQRTPSSVLNTRRIGGAPVIEYPDDMDVAPHRLSQPTDLLGAAKITGQSGGIRYGVLTALEDEPMLKASVTDSLGMAQDVHVRGEGRNFGVVRVLYENVGAARQALGYIGTHVDHPLRSATVHGLDGQYLSSDGKIRAELQTLASELRCTPSADGMERTRKCGEGVGDTQRGYGGWADLYYTQRRGLQHAVRLDFVDANLDINDVGFLERNDNFGGFYSLAMIRPNVFGLRRLSTMFSSANWMNEEGQSTRIGTFFLNTLTFQNRNELRTALRYFPRRWEDLESRGNGSYRIDPRTNIELAFGTDSSRPVAWSAQAVALSEDLGGMSYSVALGVTVKPMDRFSVDFDLQYRQRDGWLRYVWNDADFTTFGASDVQPRLAVDYFLSARQQLRLTMQWAGIRAEEQELYQIVEGEDYLQPRTRPEGDANDDFTISQLTMQLRYRWQIAPLSDLFVVYNRGSNLANAYDLDDPFAGPRDGFGQLYRDAFTDPLVDTLVIKLRYRLGG